MSTARPQSFWARARSTPSFTISFAFIALVFLLAALSLVWTPYDIARFDIPNRLQGPSLAHLFGTDLYGRDLFSMVMIGARISIMVALVAVGIGVFIGVPIGLWAAAKRGLVDEAFMRTADVIFAFPALLSAIMITAVFGPGAMNAIVAIGIFNIPVFARVARGAALSLWSREYVLAARAAGKNAAQITWQHILPNIGNVLMVQATIQFSLAVLAEAGLSYVGLGVQPPMTSWGRMLADAQTLIQQAPQMALAPGIAIILTVLALNAAGDALRDLADPKLTDRTS